MNQLQLHVPQHAHLSKSNDDKLSSRGVLSYQPGSHSSSDRTASSSLSYSEYGSYNGAPADPHMSGMYGANVSHPGISGANGRPQGGGYTGVGQVPSHPPPISGAGLQGLGYYYPQQSQQQQTHYSSVPSIPTYNGGSGNNWMRNERVFPSGNLYQAQHMQPLQTHMSPQRIYDPQEIAPHANSHIPIQGQYFNHSHGGGQSSAMGGGAGHYHMGQHQEHNFYYQPHGPVPTHQHHHPSSSFHSNSFGSSNPASYNVPNYSYEQGGHTHTSVPKVPLPSHASTSGHSSSSQCSYDLPQNGYAPSAVPYRPLSSYTSASSSSPPPPQNGYIRESNPASSHAIARPQSPEAQGQPVHGLHLHPHPQPGCTPHSSAPTSRPSGTREAKGEHQRPLSDPSADDECKGQPRHNKELVETLKKLKLKSHSSGELPSPGKQSVPPEKKFGNSQVPTCQQAHADDDNESVCMSLLSGHLSRAEEFNDKTHFLEDPSIEITEHPQNCEVARNGRVELTCKARLLNSKLGEEPIYLWYKDSEPLVGEISSECVLEEVGEEDEGQYVCVVSHPNGKCSEQTRAAQVTLRTGNGELHTCTCVYEYL